MKQLYLVRHAKSSRDDISLDDIDRPLNDRGCLDAPDMGKRLKKSGVMPDLILSSPAVRAHATAEAFAESLSYDKNKIKTDKRLYHAGPERFMEVLKELDETDPSLLAVMIFGHNPGITEFVNKLFDENIDNIPTCGVVAGKLNIDSWKTIHLPCGKLELFDFPMKKEKD